MGRISCKNSFPCIITSKAHCNARHQGRSAAGSPMHRSTCRNRRSWRRRSGGVSGLLTTSTEAVPLLIRNQCTGRHLAGVECAARQGELAIDSRRLRGSRSPSPALISRPRAPGLLRAGLADRLAHAQLAGPRSRLRHPAHGIPQGSRTSPLAELRPSLLRSCRCFLFAQM